MTETLVRPAGASAPDVAGLERRPFIRLIAAPAVSTLDPAAQRGLGSARRILEPAVPALMRGLVAFTLRVGRPLGTEPATSPSVSILNRRRRAAGLWLQAILAGDVEERTLHTVTHSLMPQLAGTGPEVARCVATARECVEFLRGQAAALIMDLPAENLVPRACALHGVDTILAVHLGALEAAATA